jgi:hypothetical protein
METSQTDFLYSSVLSVPIRSELTAHGSHYIAVEQTLTYSKHQSHVRYPASLLACQSYLEKTQLTLIVVCWTVFTELLTGNMLIKPVTILTLQRGDLNSAAVSLLRYFFQTVLVLPVIKRQQLLCPSINFNQNMPFIYQRTSN